MSRHVQVTFDAHDPRALSSFWRDVLGYVHPGPPGVDLPGDADPLAAWDVFLARAGVPEEQRNTRSAIEDPDGHGPRLFFQQVPDGIQWEVRTTVEAGHGQARSDLLPAEPAAGRQAPRAWTCRNGRAARTPRRPGPASPSWSTPTGC